MLSREERNALNAAVTIDQCSCEQRVTSTK